MMVTLTFSEILEDHHVMVILRGVTSPADAVAAANRAWDAGVELLEVPIGDLALARSLAAVVAAGRVRGKTVGAGTVLTPQHVRVADEAGARYTVAPGFDERVLAGSLAAGMPHMPGVSTPSEVQAAWAAECRWMKVFPASVLGPKWISSVKGPFPDVAFLATGGVTFEAAAEYIRAGADIVAFGAAAVAPDRCGDLAALIDKLQ